MSKIQATDLRRRFREGGQTLHVLQGVDLHVQDREWLAILGRSGSGKSTLLHLLGGLDRPDQGAVAFDGQDIFQLDEADRDRYRNTHVGFVFQFYHLLPELNALENVLITAMIRNPIFTGMNRRRQARQRAAELLHRVGLGDRLRHRPNKLSGGERQRVALARALMNQPDVLLADEPTGNLDTDTSNALLELFQSLHADGQTLVMVTHDTAVASAADRQVTLVDGKLTEA